MRTILIGKYLWTEIMSSFQQSSVLVSVIFLAQPEKNVMREKTAPLLWKLLSYLVLKCQSMKGIERSMT